MRSGREPISGARNGLAVVRVLEGLQASLDESRRGAAAQRRRQRASDGRAAASHRVETCGAASSTGLIGMARWVRATSSVAGSSTPCPYSAIAGWRCVGVR